MTLAFVGPNPAIPAKNPKVLLSDFSFVPQAQLHLRGTRNIISSEARTSLPPRAAQMNDVALCANDMLRNDVMLRINEVALRANGTVIVSLVR